MKHVNETEWNEYLAGVCETDRAAWIDAHVKDCPTCEVARQRAIALDKMLGDWQVDTAGRSVADNVLQAVESNAKIAEAASRRSLYRRIWRVTGRVAAAVVLGVSLGHWAGKSSAHNHIANREDTAVETKPGYLAALDLQFASDLTWSVLEDEPEDEEVQP